MSEEKLLVNGQTVWIKSSHSRFTRTAFQISQDIYSSLAKIGVTKAYIDLPLPRNELARGVPAQISWRVNGKEFYFQCNKQERFVDNLGVIGQVIQQESYAIRNGLKSFAQVMNQFSIGYDADGVKTKTPQEILGIPASMKDLEYITFKYKQKAKELHPDTEGGDTEKFKELQGAYEQLKKDSEEGKP